RAPVAYPLRVVPSLPPPGRERHDGRGRGCGNATIAPVPPIPTLTVGPGIAPGPPTTGSGGVADCHRRWGVPPRPGNRLSSSIGAPRRKAKTRRRALLGAAVDGVTRARLALREGLHLRRDGHRLAVVS